MQIHTQKNTIRVKNQEVIQCHNYGVCFLMPKPGEKDLSYILFPCYFACYIQHTGLLGWEWQGSLQMVYSASL